MKKTCHLAEHTIWGAAGEDFRRRVAEAACTVSVAKGERLAPDGQLGLLIKGRAAVTAKGGGKTAMKELRAGEIFGAALTDGEAVSNIVALTDCTAELLPEEFLLNAFAACPAALGYLRFLSDRVRFLNRRIGELSGGEAADRLLDYLRRRAEDGVLKIPMTRLAAELGMGRTTLYRTLDTLETAGHIRRTEAGILILTYTQRG